MAGTISSLKIDIYPELGASVGLFLRRARGRLLRPDGKTTNVLGAGIAFSRDEAHAKALSEVIERLTIHPALAGACVSHPVSLRGTFSHPLVMRDLSTTRSRSAATSATAVACHVSQEDAVRCAITEAVERRHLWAWCQRCYEPDSVSTFDLKLRVNSQADPLQPFLQTRTLRFVISWCRQECALPCVVCLALNEVDGYFYAASAAATSHLLATETALLDIAKILIFEEAFPGREQSRLARRKLSALPLALKQERRRTKSRIYPREFCKREVLLDSIILDTPAIEYETSWQATLGRHVISVPIDVFGSTPPAMEWFR